MPQIFSVGGVHIVFRFLFLCLLVHWSVRLSRNIVGSTVFYKDAFLV